MAELQWAIVDLESAGPGEILTVVYRCATYGEVADWLAAADEEKVNRGGYGVDGPADD